MPDDMKTQAELAVIGQRIREIREAGLSKKWDTLERPFPIAHMFADGKRDKMDLRDHDYESLSGAYYGLVMASWVEPYLALHARLTQLAHVSEESMYEFGNDAYVYACADREVEPEKLPIPELYLDGYETPKHKVKAFVLETQSRNYLIVLNQCYGRWSLHIRRFWADIRKARASKYAFAMSEYADRTDLTLEDVIKLAHRAAEEYGDALPGVRYPQRPMLSTLLDGNLMAGDNSAGISLRYGDFRDCGYVVSFTNDSARPEVDRGLECSYSEVAYVAINIASAIDVLGDEQ